MKSAIILLTCFSAWITKAAFPTPSQWRTNTDQVSAFTNVVKEGTNLTFSITPSNVTINASGGSSTVYGSNVVGAVAESVHTTNSDLASISILSTNARNGWLTNMGVTVDTTHYLNMRGGSGGDGYYWTFDGGVLILTNTTGGGGIFDRIYFGNGLIIREGAGSAKITLQASTGDGTFVGTVTANLFSGSGANLTALNSTNIVGRIATNGINTSVPSTFTGGLSFINWGSAPTLGTNANIGTGGGLVFTGPYTNQGHCQIQLTSGSGSSAAGVIWTNFFAAAMPDANYAVMIIPRNQEGAKNFYGYASPYYITNKSTTSFEVGIAITPVINKISLVEVLVLQ